MLLNPEKVLLTPLGAWSSLHRKLYEWEASNDERKLCRKLQDHGALEKGSSQEQSQVTYKRFLEKHTNIPGSFLSQVNWDLFG